MVLRNATFVLLEINEKLEQQECCRICTACLLSVSPSMHCSVGGVPGPRALPGPRGDGPGPGRVYLVGGCTWPQGGVPAQGSVSGPEVYLVLGCVPAQGGYLPRYSLRPVYRMTNRCKNIILPQTSFSGGNNPVP